MGPQGLIIYSGIQSLLEGNFTLGLGTTPSIARLVIPPQTQRIPEIGTLRVQYGGNGFNFPDCHLVGAPEMAVDREGREVWAIAVADHRWRWKFGSIAGDYNTRLDDFKVREKEPDTRKRPRELAQLLFEAMGEQNVQMGAIPNDQFPEVSWDWERADLNLEELLRPLGCAVRLLSNNRVSVVRLGQGAELPVNAFLLSRSRGYQSPDVPDQLRFVAGKSLWQHDFQLEAVGIDKDGSIKPVGDLSYAPASAMWQGRRYIPWGHPLFSNVTDKKCRELAAGTVFKWFRIKTPFRLPGTNADVKDLWRILPLGDRQIIKAKVGDREEFLPPYLWGEFHNGDYMPGNNIFRGIRRGNFERDPHQLYQRGFQIDHERGLVMASDYIFYNQASIESGRTFQNAGMVKQPPNLFLRLAVGLREEKTGGWFRFITTRDLRQNKVGTKPMDIKHEDIALTRRVARYQSGDIVHNQEEVDAFAKYYLDAAVESMQPDVAETYEYGGMHDIAPDGVIQQVTWRVDSTGHCYTSASRNTEHDLIHTPSFRETQFNQRVSKSMSDVEKQKEPKRARRVFR